MEMIDNVLKLIKVTDYNNLLKIENDINTKYEDLFGKRCVLKPIIDFDINRGLFLLFLEGDRTGLMTSRIVEIENDINNYDLIIKTGNSIYYFKFDKSETNSFEKEKLKKSLLKLKRLYNIR